MKKHPNQKTGITGQSGMTLVEIMIVLAIVGSLMAILLPRITGQQAKAKVQETKILMSQAINAINMYNVDCGKFPASLENLVTADSECTNWGPESYMKAVPQDAWKNDFVYSAEGNAFVLKSLGADKREGGDGFNKDLSSEDL